MRSLGTVLITGGASGLGAATVEAVGQAGGRPLVLDRVAPESGVEHALADLADRQAPSAVAELAGRTGGLDGVFTAAGIDACGPLDEVPAGGVGAGRAGEPARHREGGARRAALPGALRREGGDL